MTYELISGQNGKVEIHYTGGEFDGLVELYSQGSYVNTIKPGYRNINAPNWRGLEQALTYSPLFARAAGAVPNMFTVFCHSIQNGKVNEATENFLLYTINQLGIEWTEEEKTMFNGFLEANNFTIRLT